MHLSLYVCFTCQPDDDTDARTIQAIRGKSKACTALNGHFCVFLFVCVRLCFAHVQMIRCKIERKTHKKSHAQAVCEGPHSNSVGFLLHNTVAYVTTIAGTIKPFRCVRRAKLTHKHAAVSALFYFTLHANVLQPAAKQ